MALLSFVGSVPRAYRLKAGKADLFRNSTEPGTPPPTSRSRYYSICPYSRQLLASAQVSFIQMAFQRVLA